MCGFDILHIVNRLWPRIENKIKHAHPMCKFAIQLRVWCIPRIVSVFERDVGIDKEHVSDNLAAVPQDALASHSQGLPKESLKDRKVGEAVDPVQDRTAGEAVSPLKDRQADVGNDAIEDN